METFKPPGANEFREFFTKFLSSPTSTATGAPGSASSAPISRDQSVPYILAALIRAYEPPKLVRDLSGHTELNSYSYTRRFGQETSTIGLEFGGFADKGNYGMLYYSLRNGYGSYLLKTGLRSLKEEACLQQAAYYILGAYGLDWAVPQVYDIIEHPRYGVCFTMDNVEPVLTFGDYLISYMKWKHQCRENDIMVFEIVAQLATYILILEAQLGLNHRDLKLNNVLMVKEEPLENVVVHCSPHVKLKITASVRAVLIDFGFACIGELDRPRLLLSANEFLPSMVDMCPKVGRDMFLIFANLWNVRAFRRALTPGAGLLFKRWLTDVRGKDWALWLSSDIDKELTQTYNMVNNASFQAPWSRPIGVLTDIAAAYPEILQLESVVG